MFCATAWSFGFLILDFLSLKLKIAKMFSRTNGVWVTELFCYLIRVCLLPFRSWSAPRARLVWLIARGNDLRKPASHRKP
jgi:hypothetical protein